MNDLKVIASEGICNTASMNIYGLESDMALVGMNNDKPKWYDIEFDMNGNPYFSIEGVSWFMEDFIRVV